MIQVEELSKRYGDALAVDALSFEVTSGRIVGFLGPNGAGKTTTLRALLGLIHPTKGRALVHGVPYGQLEQPAQKVGAVLEASGFHPGRSGRNHLRIVARAMGVPAARVDEALAQVGLDGAGRKRVGKYSLGMRQRLAIAAALLGKPPALILDEPANGLDPEGIRWLRTLLRTLAEQGTAVLVSSHVLSEVALTVDEVVIINKGKLVKQGTVSELTVAQSGLVRVRSPQADALAAKLAAGGFASEARDGYLLVSGTDSARVGELAAEGGIVLHELAPEASQLEDVFLELIADEEKGERT